MDVAGLIIGVAGLVSVCVEVLERVESYKEFAITSDALLARFEAEKLRLQEWAEAVGINGDELQDIHHPRLDKPNTRLIVQGLIVSIIQLFPHAQKARSRLKGAADKSNITSIGDNTAFDFSTAGRGTQGFKASAKTKLAWTFHSAEKLARVVDSFEILVEKLYLVVPPGSQREFGDEFNSIPQQAQIVGGQQEIEVLMTVNQSLQKLWERNARLATVEDVRIINEILDPPNINDELHVNQTKRLDGTCDWIFTKSFWNHWLSPNKDPEARLGWLYGPAGTGKTILTSRIINHLKELTTHKVYFFFSTTHARSGGTLNAILRSWLAEIARIDDFHRTLLMSQIESAAGRRLPDHLIWTVFKAVISQIDNCIFIIDGLDEFNAVDNQRQDFLINFMSAVTQTASRTLITSRDEADLREALTSDVDGLSITHYKLNPTDTKEDIELVTRNVVNSKLHKTKDSSFRQELAADLATRCDGMFLMVTLYSQYLRDGMSKARLLQIAKEVPDGLFSVYQQTWQSILQQPAYEKSRAISIFRWCIFSLHPLSVGQLTELLAIPPDYNDDELDSTELPDTIDDSYVSGELVNLCRSLIELKTSTPENVLLQNTIQLVHFSVKDFLLTVLPLPREDVVDAKSIQPKSHLDLAKLCLQYLCLKNKPDHTSVPWMEGDKSTFSHYATQNWHKHQALADEVLDTELHTLAAKFLQSGNSMFSIWSKSYEEADTITTSTALYYATMLNLLATMDLLYKANPTELNALGGQYATPLQAACVKGNMAAFDKLIGWGADIGITGGAHGSALNAALSFEHVKIAEKLIDFGAPLDTVDAVGTTPFHLACQKGFIGIVKKLITDTIHLDQEIEGSITPINVAVMNNNFDVVELLIEKGAAFERPCDLGRTPLMNAAMGGQLRIVKLLVDHGADIMRTDTVGWTPLHLSAVGEDHEEIVRFLVEKGAQVDLFNHAGNTPLCIASCNGHIGVVRALLAAGAKVNHVGKEESSSAAWSPINIASEKGHLSIVQLLLENGGDPEIVQKTSGVTALISAAEKGFVEVVKLLLTHKANALAKDEDGSSAMHCAARNGYFQVVKTLLEHTCGPLEQYRAQQIFTKATTSTSDDAMQSKLLNFTNINGWNSLSTAAWNGHVDIVKLLLSYNIMLNVPTSEGWTAISSASGEGHTEIVRLLLEHQVDVEIPTQPDLRTPLHYAAANNHLHIVEALLQYGANISAADTYGQTALFRAAFAGHLDVVKLLLDWGADISHEDTQNWTPLSGTCTNGHLHIAKVLIEKGARVDHITDAGWQSIGLAAYHGHLDLVKFLYEKYHLSVNRRTANGCTPITAAAEAGHVDVVRYLLDVGADLGLTTDDGLTALHASANSGHQDMVEFLLDSGMACDILDKHGRTPLFLCVRGGNFEIFKLLHSRGANATHKTNFGWSPIHTAVDNNRIKVVEYLLDSLEVSCETPNEAEGTNIAYSPLSLAACGGHLEIMNLLLDRGAIVNTTIGSSPLHSAVDYGHMEAVKLLLSHGADCNLPRETGETALALAAARGNYDASKLFLAHGGQVKLSELNSPIWYAAANNHFEVLELLVENGSDINALADSDKWTPLAGAANNGHIEAVKYLLTKGADDAIATKSGAYPIQCAASNNHLEIVEFLLDRDVKKWTTTDSDNWSLLMDYVPKGSELSVMKLLLTKGLDIKARNSEDWTVLGWTSSRGSVDTATHLLDLGADPMATTSDILIPIHGAVINSRLEVAKLLCDRGTKFSKGSITDSLVGFAARTNNADMVNLLLDHGANIDGFLDGYTALNTACEEGYETVFKCLVDRGANVNQMAEQTEAPLYSAIKAKHYNLASQLVLAGADCSRRTFKTVLPLHIAAKHGDLGMVRMFSQTMSNIKPTVPAGSVIVDDEDHPSETTANKESIHIVDSEGRNALHFAVEGDNVEVLTYLLDLGLDPRVKDKDGQDLLAYASKSTSVAMARACTAAFQSAS